MYIFNGCHCLFIYLGVCKMEQRAAVKFCYKCGKTATETFQMMKTAYGGECLSKTTVYEWHKRFREGHESLQDDERSGRPTTSKSQENIDGVRTLIERDRRSTCRMIADELHIPKTTVHEILTEILGKKKVCAKFVPHFLTPEQKEQRVNASRDFVQMVTNNPNFLKSIVTGDESWCFEYDPSTKRQSSEWITPGTPKPKKVRSVKSKIKTMLIAFFDSDGIIHHEFLPKGHTLNAAFYKEVIQRLLARIRRVRPEFYQTGDWFLLQDNAPSHSSILVNQFLAKRQVTSIVHPPYSPDLAPADFFLFPKLKLHLKGTRFTSVEEIQTSVTRHLNVIPKEDFSRAFQKLHERCEACIERGGHYVEN